MLNEPRCPIGTWLAYISKMRCLENFCSSSRAISISVSLRLTVFSGDRKNPRDSCMVSVEPPCPRCP
jgi:hypothetical protein